VKETPPFKRGAGCRREVNSAINRNSKLERSPTKYPEKTLTNPKSYKSQFPIVTRHRAEFSTNVRSDCKSVD